MNALMREFVRYLQTEKKVSANTLSSYTRDIRQFADYISINSLDVIKITKTKKKPKIFAFSLDKHRIV